MSTPDDWVMEPQHTLIVSGAQTLITPNVDQNERNRSWFRFIQQTTRQAGTTSIVTLFRYEPNISAYKSGDASNLAALHNE